MNGNARGSWSGGNSYSAKDLARMQQEAVERVRDMQERSRRVLEEAQPIYPEFARRPTWNQPAQGGPPAPHEAPPPARGEPSPSRTAERHGGLGGLLSGLGGLLGGTGGTGPISRVMDALHLDNDKLLILMLLLVLINNNADKKLILALGYLLI